MKPSPGKMSVVASNLPNRTSLQAYCHRDFSAALRNDIGMNFYSLRDQKSNCLTDLRQLLSRVSALVAKGRGGELLILPEQAHQRGVMLVADLLGDVDNWQVGLGEQGFGFLEA